MPYITEYSNLHPKEQRQLSFKRRFKAEVPDWDDTMVLLKNEVEKRIGTNLKVLDAGCGHGNYLIDELRNRFSYAAGVDVSEEVMNKNICLDEKFVGNIETLPFENNFFDLVVSLWVFEHLEHPEKVFSEISRVLKPQGYFAFVTPNKKSALIALRRMMNQSVAEYLVEKIYRSVIHSVQFSHLQIFKMVFPSPLFFLQTTPCCNSQKSLRESPTKIKNLLSLG